MQWPNGLSGASGVEYWRSLAELAGDQTFVDAVGAEFPPGADLPGPLSRREWLKLLGASMALAGAGGCSRKHGGKILPYTRTPEDVTPGIPRYYATSLSIDGFATGVLVEMHDGRPTKVEGNPDHPASLGATTAFDQAAVLSLYDPDRATSARAPRGLAGWQAFFTQFAGPRADRGAGLRFLMEPSGSPLVGNVIDRIRTRFPDARFTFYAPGTSANAEDGGLIAFGTRVQARHDFSRAKVILALDDDFLASGPFAIRNSREFAQGRRVSSPSDAMNRLYVVETDLTPTGSMADHRLPRRPSEVASVAANTAAELLVSLGVRPPGTSDVLTTALFRHLPAVEHAIVRAIARDLAKNAGASLVTVGCRQPPIVHALAYLINTVVASPDLAWHIAPTRIRAGDGEQDLPSLVHEISQGKVETLVILEGNPVYTAPADFDLARVLPTVPTVVYLGSYENETAAAAGWFVPAAHPLETWGDATAYDGTVSLLQPLLEPLYGGRTTPEILAVFSGVDYPDSRRLLQAFWMTRRPADDFERFWQETLKRGVVVDTALPKLATTLRLDAIAGELTRLPPPSSVGTLEAVFVPDPCVYDGRFANNPWLLELPKPATKLTWGNAVLLSPTTAGRLDIATEDVVMLELAGRRVTAPALVAPGHADDAATLHLGYGRGGGETIALGVGFNAYVLRTNSAPHFAPGLSISKVRGKTEPLARTQLHWATEGRPIALSATIDRFRAAPNFTQEQKRELPTLFPPPQMNGDQWAMSIDTSICTGCSACVVACQAENNILVVGKDQVLKGREMHWLRIDTYYHGPPENPRSVHEPMLCQHCEKAPCEYVCPVNATVHSPDGLNEMVYNRCVGTRFCSNNCPYKVRRFNWFNWTEHERANRGLVRLQHNPDVTVRQRGVMEKCTYCVQRIREAEIHARVDNRAIRESEVTTACAQACPTSAIQFGSLRHRDSKMFRWREELRSFNVLHEQGTHPRTMYLARIDNPNPEIP